MDRGSVLCGGVWRSRLLLCAYGALLAACQAAEQCATQDGDIALQVQREDQAIRTSVDLIGADLVAGFTTYQIRIHLANSSANCYTIYGDGSLPMLVPPAYQCATPFGVDVGGTNPAFWQVANSDELGFSQYDSWLTVGITDGDDSSALSSIGLDFRSWDENTALESDVDAGGAVFWMNPGDASGSVDRISRSMVVAQLTVRSSGESARMAFNAQGRSVGWAADSMRAGAGRDWEEVCIHVFVGGEQNGQGNHAYNPAGPAPPPARPPPPVVAPPPPPPSLPKAPPPPPGVEASPTPWLSLYIPSPPECPLSDVRARIAELDAICCVGGACEEGVNGGAPTSCSPMCGGKLLHLYSTCNRTLDILFDGQDGSYDGVASTFSDLRHTCLQLSPRSIIDEMKQLEDSGCELNANGVGQEAVQQQLDNGGCTDSGGTELCALIALGALSCDKDFCQDKSTCAHASACDHTCGFCRRRSQISFDGGCSPLTLQSRVEPVNGACCDEDGACNGGGAGVPTVCDAKCAIVYGPFYEQCMATLERAFGSDAPTFDAFSQLASTCDSLPVDQLLEATAAAICPNAEPAAQPDTGGFGNWLDAALDCPLGMLERYAVSIDNQCCADDPDKCFWPEGGSPAECNLKCGVAMIGSNSHCTKTMDLVLDGMDGDRDGQSHVVDDLYRKCNAIPPRAIILHLKELQDQGCPVDVNGVSETTVDTIGGDTCVDTADSTLCSLIESGLLSCSVDFCPGVCPHAYACDATCGFCQADGEDDHSSTPSGRRSLQIDIDESACDASEFQARTDRVNVQCCDNNQCNSGVPTTCDAKCAMEYLSYYSDCAAQIAVSFPPSEQYGFANLRQTCLSLPLQPLMAVVAAIDCDSTESGSSSASGGEAHPPPAPGAHSSEDSSRCSDVTLLSRATSVDYSSHAHAVLGVRHYDAGTIAVIQCSPGDHPSKTSSEGANAVAMACKHGEWSDETGNLIRCQSGH